MTPDTPREGRDPDGYRREARGGPTIRADIVDVYVFRTADDARTAADSAGVEFLQLLRSGDPLARTWQPVMGHCEGGERAPACALRELREEVGLSADGAGQPALLAFYALEQVHPFYLAAIDAVVLSPRFAAHVARAWSPRLNHEHTAARWVPASEIDRRFLWPGQRATCREILSDILAPAALARDLLRIDL